MQTKIYSINFAAKFSAVSNFEKMRRLCRRFCATAEEQKPRVIFVSIPIAAVGVCIFSYVTREMYNANWFAKPRFHSSTFDEEKTFRASETAKLQWLQLVRWLKRNGGEINPRIRLGVSAHEKQGVFAMEDIPADTVLCRIPPHLRIGRRVLTNTEIVTSLIWRENRLSQSLGGLYGCPMDCFALALFLCEQAKKGRKSPWWPYIESLPRDFMSPYLSLDLKIIAFNFGFITTRQMKNARQYVSKTFRYIKAEAPELGENLRVDDWCHYWSLAQSRGFIAETFSENLGKFSVTSAMQGLSPFKSELIPFVDLMNHAEDASGRWISERHICVSTRPIKKGEEICIDYHTNWRNTNDKLYLVHALPPVKALQRPPVDLPDVKIQAVRVVEDEYGEEVIVTVPVMPNPRR